MRDKDLKKILCSVRRPEIDREKKQSSIDRILLSAGDVRGLRRISHWERVGTILPYISPWVWAAQGFILLLCGFLYLAAPPKELLVNLGTLAPLLGCAACVELQRGMSCNMWELEQSCRYDLRQLALLKMQVTGGADLLLICAMIAFGAGGGADLSMAILGILVPFLASSAVYFFILCRTNRRASAYLLLAVGLILGVFMRWLNEWLVLGETGAYLQAHGEYIALAVLTAADVLLIAVRKYTNHFNREEQVKWNYE